MKKHIWLLVACAAVLCVVVICIVIGAIDRTGETTGGSGETTNGVNETTSGTTTDETGGFELPEDNLGDYVDDDGTTNADPTNSTDTTLPSKPTGPTASTEPTGSTEAAEEKEFNIQYEGLEGTTHTNPSTYKASNASAISLTAPSERAGYTFEGWFLGNTRIISLKGCTGDLVLTAIWIEENGGGIELPEIDF